MIDKALLAAKKPFVMEGEITLCAPVVVNKETGETKPSNEYDIAISHEFDLEDYGWMKRTLLHGKDNVNLERYNNKASILYGHDGRNRYPIGYIMPNTARVDSDKTLRARMYLTEVTQAAKDAKALVDDGVLTKISVGAMIDEVENRAKKGEVPHYYAVKWTPYEASLVAVPADDKVGVGKSLAIHLAELEKISLQATGGNKMETQENLKGAGENTLMLSKEDLASEVQKHIAAHEQKTAEKKAEIASKRKTFIENSGMDYDDAVKLERDALAESWSYEKFVNEAAPILKKRFDEDPDKASKKHQIGMTQKEVDRFDTRKFMAVALEMDGNDDFEGDCSFEREIVKACKPFARKNGAVLPMDVLVKTPMPDEFMTEKAVANTNANSVGDLIETRVSSRMIDTFRDQSQVMKAKPTTLAGLRGNIDVPTQENDVTLSYKAIDSDTGDNAITYDTKPMSMKTASGGSGLSRAAMMRTNFGLSNRIMRSILGSVALNIDTSVLNGSGTNNQPRGILQQSTQIANGLGGSTTYSKTTGLTWAQVGTAMATMRQKNVMVDTRGGAWFMTPEHYYQLVTHPKVANTDNFVINMKDGPGADYLMKSPVYVKSDTAALPALKTVFGDFFYLYLGIWNLVEIVRDTATGIAGGSVIYRVYSDIDVHVAKPDAFIQMTRAA